LTIVQCPRTPSRLLRIVLSAVTALAAVSGFAAGDPTYTAFRAARPDGRTVAVQNLSFERDAYRVTLNGALHLLPPVAGKDVGAVFIGRGAYELTPSSENERKMLAVYTADPPLKSLRDDFDSMILFDADLMARAAKGAAPGAGAPDPAAGQAWDRFLNFEQKELKSNLHLRVLQAVLNAETTPMFLGVPAGKKFARVVLICDGQGYMDGEETALLSADQQRGGTWYSSHLRGERPHAGTRLATASHYSIEASTSGRDDLSSSTVIDAINATDGLRVLPLQLDSRLRIDQAEFSLDAKSWKELAVVQEKEKEDGNAAVIFPEALEQGQLLSIRVKVHGNGVLRDAGDGNFYVQARSAWYPNLGTFTDLATYDLTYSIPKAYQIVSVGDPAGDKIEGDRRVMTFKAAQSIRVAGFNIGRFRKISRADNTSGVAVDVYTNPGTPNIIKELNAALAAYRESAKVTTDYGTTIDMEGGPSEVYLDMNGLADSAMADAINTARVGTAYFGALPLKHVAITQQTQWDFGQSWPGLVYLPYLAAVSSTVRATLGGARDNDFVEQVGPHEMAHQWWGHTVGAATYHDAWLNEGFADFTAALVLQQTGGVKRFNGLWEMSRRAIVSKPPGAFIQSFDAGPLTQGVRLATWRNPSAYYALVYGKGSYVVHMLRMLMQGRGNNPDADFIAMMADFARTYGGRNATTEDFKAMVDKHMIAALNATGNGKSDWFFNQWVYGTAIPRYTSQFDVKPGAEGKFHITGSMTQAEVPEDFRMMVPIYAEFDRGQVFKIAQIPIIGSTTRPIDFEVKLPKKPGKILLNAMHDVLSR